MKKTLRYTVLLVISSLLVSTSCNKFLEEDLRDQITPENFFNNDKEAELAVNGVYRLLHDNSLYGLRGLDDYYTSGADEQGPSRAVNPQIHNYLIAEGVADGNDSWITLYRIVNNTTEFIAKIEGNEKISQSARDSNVGQLLFLRALAYYHLTNLWGDVPYYRSPMPVVERSVLGRTKKEQIRKDMKDDLAKAIPMMQTSYTGTDLGRATKWAAATLKAKYHLFDKEWADAKTECDFIIKNSPHTLLANFADVFDRTSSATQYNAEVIFAVDFISNQVAELQAGRTDDYNPRIRDEPSNRNGNIVVNGKTMKRADYFQSLLLAQGEDMTGFGWAIPLPELASKSNWQAGDLRYDATVISSYLGFTLTFPYFKKNWNLNQATSARDNHPDNYIVFRLADVYLMAAEAENEVNGPAAAYAYVNKVRERAFNPDQPFSGLTQTTFRIKIQDERKFELAAEGHRRMDLIRWGKLLEVVKATKQRAWNNPAANIKPYHVLLPIPEKQIILNPNLLTSDPTNNGYR
jgi:hypothetical protein